MLDFCLPIRTEHLMFNPPSAGFVLAGTLTSLLLAGVPAAHAQANSPQPAMTNQQLVASFSSDPRRLSFPGGETLYQSVCQGCHMPNGEGAYSGAGFFPALRNNPKLAAGAYPVLAVLNGLHGMPPFAAWLDDQQVADTVNYIRTRFGNDFKDPVRPEDVKQIRGAR